MEARSPSKAVVASPKYQTLPAVSWAYQSKVFSTTLPCSSLATSWTTVVVTPATTLVRSVTVTTLVSSPSGEVVRYFHTVPGTNGR